MIERTYKTKHYLLGEDTDHVKVVISCCLMYIKSENLIRKSGEKQNFHMVSTLTTKSSPASLRIGSTNVRFSHQ